MTKTIQSTEINLGARYNAPVYFDDGENMFLAAGSAVKAYHLIAIKRWGLKTFITDGVRLPDDFAVNDASDVEEVDELEELEEVEELEEL